MADLRPRLWRPDGVRRAPYSLWHCGRAADI